jgi:hypothetical protein
MSPLVPYTEKGMNFLDLSVKEKEKGIRQHLLYSIGKSICLHQEDENREFQIAVRRGFVDALAVYENRLVHAEQPAKSLRPHTIFYTETGEPIAERESAVRGFVIYNGLLVDADAEEVRYTETDESIAARFDLRADHSPEFITALTIYEGSLIDATQHFIRYTETGEEIAESRHTISALATYNGRLVKAESFCRDRLHFEGWIRYAEKGKLIAARPNEVRALAIYNNRLIDAGGYGGIVYTEEEKEPIVKTERPVNALLPIDNETANSLLTLPGVREIK